MDMNILRINGEKQVGIQIRYEIFEKFEFAVF
jgi:hypothetical protein